MADCYWCKGLCSGDTTEHVKVDGRYAELPICDEPDLCPANAELAEMPKPLAEAWLAA